MEPELTKRDLQLLFLNEKSWITLGAVLGLQARMLGEEVEVAGGELLESFSA